MKILISLSFQIKRLHPFDRLIQWQQLEPMEKYMSLEALAKTTEVCLVYTWADWHTSNKLYNKVWFLCWQNWSNSSIIKIIDLAVFLLADFKDSNKKVRFSKGYYNLILDVFRQTHFYKNVNKYNEHLAVSPENVPNTLLAVSFSKNSCLVISWIAIRSSVWKNPCNLITTESFWRSQMVSKSASTLLINCKSQLMYH